MTASIIERVWHLEYMCVPELVEHGDVGVHVVDVVGVGRVLLPLPQVGSVHLTVQHGVLVLQV